MRKGNQPKCRSTGRDDLDSLVWQQTMEECEAGWMRDPLSEDEVCTLVGSKNWLATRRFPSEQKDKVRMIDDALAGLNPAYGTSNKLTLWKYTDLPCVL